LSWIRNIEKVNNHKPVMANELIDILSTIKPRLFIDCTFGGGGHCIEVRKNFSICEIFAIDRDDMSEQKAIKLQSQLDPFTFVKDRFGNIEKYNDKIVSIQLKNNITDFKDIVFFADLGMSNLQLFDSKRGFSFQNKEAVLDIGMGVDSEPILDLLNTGTMEDIYKMLSQYGEERYSEEISSAIIKNRPIIKVGDFVKIVEYSTPYRGIALKSSLSRIFQSLRIQSNNEVNELLLLLKYLENFPGATIIFISFHSIEDRIVKHWMKANCNKKYLKFPSRLEAFQNFQSSSAKMRFCVIS
jgi:16S rRNA (cytosine1402-N4)-methyltransferase